MEMDDRKHRRNSDIAYYCLLYISIYKFTIRIRIRWLFSGLIAGAAQSLSIDRQYSKIVPMISASLGWALAFLFGYLLVVKESTSTFVLMPNDFFSALLLGWGPLAQSC